MSGTKIANAGLLYHVWPLRKAEELLNWHFDVISQRVPLLTGKKVVTVSTDSTSFDSEWVRLRVPWADDVAEVPNNPQLREVAGWRVGAPKLLENDGPIFFAHAKGVSRVGGNYGDLSRDWADLLYRTSLDVPDVVRERLDRYSLAGSLKKVGKGFSPESQSMWHYHGAFYWIRQDLFRSSWNKIIGKWFGVESWPGDVVRDPRDAGVLFKELPLHQLNMYSRTMAQGIIEEGNKWIESQRSSSSTATCPTA